jgi:hypothetical protein
LEIPKGLIAYKGEAANWPFFVLRAAEKDNIND